MGQDRKINIAVVGASGYTGSDLVRLGLRHPNIIFQYLVAKTHAGKSVEAVFPHLGGYGLPDMVEMSAVDWDKVDAVFCGLPHATAHEIIATIPERIKVIDMSADFRLRDPETYAQWYGGTHNATDLLKTAVYGLSEHYREELKQARLVACPGCYPTATLMALLPALKSGCIQTKDIIIDAKSGVSGAGRAPKQMTLAAEAGEGLSPYAVTQHRHAPEIEQELGVVAGRDDIIINFTPHLVPMTRGELVTCYVKLAEGKTADDLRTVMDDFYEGKPFVRVLTEGAVPSTQHVRGSNNCLIAVFADRIKGRAIIISTLDNLVKGSAGQALQNFNLMFGLDETTGLQQVAMFP